jgi:HD-GYP domain-containing protein (c-di-GMP phosphodiesterase class II)
MAEVSGTQFDPAVVNAFLSVPLEEWLRIRSSIDELAAQDHGAARVPEASAPALAPPGA